MGIAACWVTDALAPELVSAAAAFRSRSFDMACFSNADSRLIAPSKVPKNPPFDLEEDEGAELVEGEGLGAGAAGGSPDGRRSLSLTLEGVDGVIGVFTATDAAAAAAATAAAAEAASAQRIRQRGANEKKTKIGALTHLLTAAPGSLTCSAAWTPNSTASLASLRFPRLRAPE